MRDAPSTLPVDPWIAGAGCSSGSNPSLRRRTFLELSPEALTYFVLLAAAIPTAYTGGSGAFVMAAGDVSLDYALAFFQRSAPAFVRDAGTVLQRLKRAENR